VQHLNPPKELLDGTGMLRNGDSGQEVKDAKALLVAAGYKLDMNNDKFGPATEKAVRDYQHRHPQLEESGILDPATRAALKRDASMKTSVKTTAKTGATTGTGTGGTDAVTASTSRGKCTRPAASSCLRLGLFRLEISGRDSRVVHKGEVTWLS
jgi:peptidoglycan hydrolase-like protein with peptidoglycan-binding domain